jgi:hypothetical protein
MLPGPQAQQSNLAPDFWHNVFHACHPLSFSPQQAALTITTNHLHFWLPQSTYNNSIWNNISWIGMPELLLGAKPGPTHRNVAHCPQHFI